jgi:hypothetical protein
MTNGYLTMEEARSRLRQATQIVLDAEGKMRAAATTKAESEAVYRRELGAAFARYRKDGMGVEESNITARAEVAVHAHDRDLAADLFKVAGEELENARDSRRSLWRLIEWSMAHEKAAASAQTYDERLPGATWPK